MRAAAEQELEKVLSRCVVSVCTCNLACIAVGKLSNEPGEAITHDHIEVAGCKVVI